METKGSVDLMPTFGQGKLSWSFTVRYLIMDANTFNFALIRSKILMVRGPPVSTPHLKMKFPTLIGEIIIVEANRKQAR